LNEIPGVAGRVDICQSKRGCASLNAAADKLFGRIRAVLETEVCLAEVHEGGLKRNKKLILLVIKY
jgi:hypothetical protein